MNVVSFYAPRPEHPFFQDYTPFLDLLRASCKRFGHRHIVLTDDPSVGDDAYVTELPRSLMKATIAAQLAYLSNPRFADVPTLLTGADCVLGKDPVTGLTAADVTITTDDRFQDCRMNCGAIFIPRPALLAPVWADALSRCGDEWGEDQTSVYAALQASGLRIVEFPCDPYNLAPAHPGEDCSRGVVLHFRGPRKRWMVDYCHKWLGLGEGVAVKALPNSDASVVLENVRINAARQLPWIVPIKAHDWVAVLIGGGPSLADDLPEIRRMHKPGTVLFALNNAANFLKDAGIYADRQVILDPREDNVRFLNPMCSLLLASQCHPSLFKAAHEQDVGRVDIWHFPVDGIADILPRDATLIGGGLTVGLTAMGLVFAMGYRKMHLFGYDSSDLDGAAHAYEQEETPAEAKRMEVWVGSHRFVTNAAMYAQAEAFERWADLLAENGTEIIVHGTGLLPTIAHQMAANRSALGEAA